MSVTKPEKEKSTRLRDKLQGLRAWIHGADMRCLLLMVAGALILFALCCIASVSNRYSLEVGDIADRNIAAPKEVEDRLATREQQDHAANAIGPSYHLAEAVNAEVLDALAAIFAELQTVQEYGKALIANNGGSYANPFFTDEEVRYAQQLVTTVTLSHYQTRIIMGTDEESFAAMRDTVTSEVVTTLNQTITEGQERDAVNDIIEGCRPEMSSELLAIVRPVLTTVVRANMLEDREATDAARARARAAVPPVIYKQGQYIIRQGERITENQLEMLGELGLLTSSEFNFSVYGGALLLILCALMVLWMMLRLLEPSALVEIRTMVVILLVMIISAALSALCITLIDAYLAPVALCTILLTGLMGPRIGLAGGMSMTVVIAGLSAASIDTYSTEMICLLLTGLIGNILSVNFLRGRPQRVGAVVCGTLVAVSNLIVMLGIGLMTAVSLEHTIFSAVWSMAGGLLSGLIAVGFQPVFEAAFNLPTASKLLELANPNHPLLRRLLMEAPGTYHHSIIVANLAEAAAERIGANMLLARTGAYYHDVGKLKRPLYFKENQHGDNPHDRTTAHLSAAIVTAHTTDGLRMAQKHHLPPEIQRIIVEHHGDTPVMYFYHKALQQADGKPVDVKDFRYSGSRPTTRESAIVMLADTVEAAVRSMSEPTPQAIAQFIERLVRGKIEDGQLSNSPLTLHDIDGISEAFINVLRGVFHERIEYPTLHIDRRAEEEPEDDVAHSDTAEAGASGMAAPYSAPLPDGMVPSGEVAARVLTPGEAQK